MFLRKYGVAATFVVPMPKAGSPDFSVTADWTPATGDVKVSKSDGSVANITTLPSAIGGTGSALWLFSLSATEMQATHVTVQIVDSATKVVDDNAFIIDTYGNASAQHEFDLDTPTVTALTVSDKTGYALSAAGLDLITMTEPSAAGAFGTISIRQAVAWLYARTTNRMLSTSSTKTLRNRADNATISTSSHSDDGTTYTTGLWS